MCGHGNSNSKKRVSNADLDGIDVVTDPSHVRKATADLSRGFRPRPGLPTCR